jgi:hypothetical protein
MPAARTKSGDPLPSWNEGIAKRAILDFIHRSTSEGDDFVPVDRRIAVFDNDGTLWCEQPMYVQLAFAFDRLKALAPQHPEWAQEQPFQGILEGDLHAVAASGERGIARLLAATHVGNTTTEFEAIVEDWLAEARHPKSHHRYGEMIYQPMLELLAFLRARAFKTFIVSGGGVEFMRPWVRDAYGVPSENVVGSRVRVKYERRGDGKPALVRLAEIDLVDDGPGKPVGIHQGIGRRPIAAFGNSDGDLEMLEWTTSAPAPTLGLVVHHTDAEREYAYDRASPVGRLSKVLDDAPRRGWVLTDMKRDWKVIYPFDM